MRAKLLLTLSPRRSVAADDRYGDGPSRLPLRKRRVARPFAFGPGLVSGASDADPTTVASLAVVGAATGFTLSWLVVLLLPMIAVVQSIAATIGAICPTSFQGAIRRHYGLTWALLALVAVLAVNVMTLTADLEAGAESLKLLTGVSRAYFVLPFAGLVAWLLVSRSYSHVERLLSFLPLIFVCYGISAVLAKPDWGGLAHSLTFPHFDFTTPVATGALALLGTTLTSYVYYWEAIGVSERGPAPSELRSAKVDAALGALAPGICFLFILVATAATLGTNHTPVQTGADAAAALRPLAGHGATALFAIGLLASAAIAVPVLAGTSAYVVTQTFGWPGGLDAPIERARVFYGVLLGSLAISAALALVGVSPIALLYWASVAGGLATPLTLCFLVAIAQNRAIMGENRVRGPLVIAGWSVTAVVTASCVAFLASAIHNV
ncbi:MAG: divalent metal cation transporter [Candidatus Cybelea sp.]